MRTTRALAASLAIVALSGAGAVTPAAAQAQDGTAAGTPSTTVEWQACGPGNECAVVQAPLDYDDPDAGTVDLHLARHRANRESQGSLFVNPGGPGYGAEEMVHGFGQFGPPPINDNLDLVGIDPRGTGKSGLVDCNINLDEDKAFEVTTDDGLGDDIDHFIADFASLAETCTQEHSLDYLASLTTENAARDMEFVRQLLGEEQISFLGHSYGAGLGWVYASLFPDHVRAMVLDSPITPNPDSYSIEQQAGWFEQALTRADASCDRWSDCPVAETGLLETIEQVRDELSANGNIGALDGYEFESAVFSLTAIPVVLRDLAPGLQMALEGNGSLLADIGGSFFTELPTGGLVEYSAAPPALLCADGGLDVGTSEELLSQAERTFAAAPNAGPGWMVPCDLWPVVGTGIPVPDYTGSAPIVVVGTRHDAVTPYAWAEELADALGPNGTLLTWDGSGHANAFTGADFCLDGHLFALLLDGVVPEPGTTCSQRGFVGLQWPDGPGQVVINGVTPGGTADQAGVQVGDIVLEADGQPVASGMDVPEGAMGSTLELKLQRGDEIVDVVMERGAPVWELWREAE